MSNRPIPPRDLRELREDVWFAAALLSAAAFERAQERANAIVNAPSDAALGRLTEGRAE